MAEVHFSACPIAGYNQFADLLTAYNNHKADLQPISTRYPNPSIGLLDALQTVQITHDEYTKRRIEEKNGNG